MGAGKDPAAVARGCKGGEDDKKAANRQREKGGGLVGEE